MKRGQTTDPAAREQSTQLMLEKLAEKRGQSTRHARERVQWGRTTTELAISGLNSTQLMLNNLAATRALATTRPEYAARLPELADAVARQLHSAHTYVKAISQDQLINRALRIKAPGFAVPVESIRLAGQSSVLLIEQLEIEAARPNTASREAFFERASAVATNLDAAQLGVSNLSGYLSDPMIADLLGTDDAETASRTPSRSALRLVDLAVSILPATAQGRYNDEFRSELWDMPAKAQRRHALRVLLQSWNLRRSLLSARRPPDPD